MSHEEPQRAEQISFLGFQQLLNQTRVATAVVSQNGALHSKSIIDFLNLSILEPKQVET
jgi:hypothetical protein